MNQMMRRMFVLGVLSVATVSWGAADANPEMKDVVFKAKLDGTEQRYVVILPPAFNMSKTYDVLFSLHGHGSDRWQCAKDNRGEFKASRDIATARKMIFVSPDYRATTSWMGPAAEADMLQIIEALRKHYRVGRIFISGASMGASSSLTFAARHPELISGVVSMNGLADHLGYKNFQDAIAASFGCTKEKDPNVYRERSALYFPERFTMPVAFTFGGKDGSVPPDSGRKLAALIKKHQPNVYVIDRPNCGHATNYEDALDAFKKMFHWADTAQPSKGAAKIHQWSKK